MEIDRSLVQLRDLAESDVDEILGWVNDPDIVGNIAAFSGERLTREQELAYVRSMLSSTSDQVWSIVETSDGSYAGQVGLHQIHWRSRVGRLGCIMGSREKMGRGLGSAAISRAIDEAFSTLDLHKVWLMIFAKNQRAFRTYRRLGFVVEGTLREEYYHQGGWHDMIRMSLLHHEWC